MWGDFLAAARRYPRSLPCRSTDPRDQLLSGAHHPVREEEHHRHEQAPQHEQPQVGIGRREEALQPVHAQGAHHRPQQGAPPAHRDPDDHLDGRQHADLGRRDDADLGHVERARHPGQHRGDHEHEDLERGGRVAGEEHAVLAVADGDQHPTRRGAGDPPAHEEGPAQTDRGRDVESALGGRAVEAPAEDALEAAQAVGSPQVHRVAIEQEPRGEREGLRDDREVDAPDAAAEREVAEHVGEERRHHEHREQGERDAVEGLPEERQLLHLVPHHEVRQHVAVDAPGPDLQHQVHAHRVGPEPEEDPVAQREDAGVAPDQVDAECEDRVGQELAEEVQGEVGHPQRRPQRQGVQGGQHHDQRDRAREEAPALRIPHSVPWSRRGPRAAAG